jgi:hypothetical protein
MCTCDENLPNRKVYILLLLIKTACVYAVCTTAVSINEKVQMSVQLSGIITWILMFTRCTRFKVYYGEAHAQTHVGIT